MLFFSGYNELYLQIARLKKNYANIYKYFIEGSHRRFSICNGSLNFNLMKSFISFLLLTI